MRRATIALGIVAILASSCGDGEVPGRLGTTLENRVARIRTFAEDGRPGLARAELRKLVELVVSRRDAGRIDDGRATVILAAAESVDEQLTLLPRTAPTRSPSPSPTLTEEGGEGGGEGKPDKDMDKGHGDEGHGNDG